jgi:short-subunit dehydrogenase
MAKTLAGQAIVVTGASSGIGAATAIACSRAGMCVILNGRDANRLESVAGEIRELGGQAEVVVGDVTDEGLSGRLLDIAESRFGGFYAVFANAGYGVRCQAHRMSMEDLRRMFEVNFFSAYELVCEATRRLLSQKRPGHLLMCSSAVAKFTLRNFSAYSATKAAQNHVCRAMRLELRRQGIEVSSVHPVTTRTDFFRRSAELAGRQADPERLFDHVPRWYVQSAEQVARAVVKCLRRPRAEVWTSPLTRFAAGLMTAFPALADLVARRADRS